MKDKMIKYWRKGDPYILMTGLGLLLSLSMVVFMLSIILVKGLGFFWPRDIQQTELMDGSVYLGELWSSEPKKSRMDGKIIEIPQTQLKIGNRDIYSADFKWFDDSDIKSISYPENAIQFERMEYGNFYGFIKEIYTEEGLNNSVTFSFASHVVVKHVFRSIPWF